MLARIHVLRQEYDTAENIYKKGLYYNETSAALRREYAKYLRSLGRYNEALIELKRVQKVDPFSQGFYGVLISVLADSKMYNEAKSIFEEADTLFPDEYFIHMQLGRLYNKMGEYEKAIDIFRKYKDKYRLGITYAMIGDREKAYEQLGEVTGDLQTDSYMLNKAIIDIWLGNTELALDILDQIFENNRVVLEFIKCDYEYDPVRDHPRFIALIKKMNLPLD